MSADGQPVDASSSGSEDYVCTCALAPIRGKRLEDECAAVIAAAQHLRLWPESRAALVDRLGILVKRRAEAGCPHAVQALNPAVIAVRRQWVREMQAVLPPEERTRYLPGKAP